MTMLFYFAFLFFNDTATTEIYTLSLHDALPICGQTRIFLAVYLDRGPRQKHRLFYIGLRLAEIERLADLRMKPLQDLAREQDRKSTRLNSSHPSISYAVFCLKKKKKNKTVHNYE